MNHKEHNTKWGIVFGTQTAITQPSTKLIDTLNFKKIPITQSPLEVFSKIYKQFPTAYLLESMEGPKKLAQFSFVGFSPKITIQVKDGITITHNELTGEETKEKTTDPLNTIQRLVEQRATANKEFRFAGGAVGYISYDAVRYWEKLPTARKDDLDFPDVEMGIFDDGIVFDHKQKRSILLLLQQKPLFRN